MKLGEVQNPFPFPTFRRCRESLYPVHMFAATFSLGFRYSVLYVLEYEQCHNIEYYGFYTHTCVYIYIIYMYMYSISLIIGLVYYYS